MFMFEGARTKLKQFENRLYNSGKIFRESQNKVVLLIGIVTVRIPYGTFFHGAFRSGEGLPEVTISILALFWAVLLPEVWGYSGLQVLNPNIVLLTLPLGSLSIVYAFAVMNYCKNPQSRKLVLFAAVLSVLLPTLQTIFTYEVVLGTGLLLYIGPLPIQLIVGLFLVYFCKPRIEETPW